MFEKFMLFLLVAGGIGYPVWIFIDNIKKSNEKIKQEILETEKQTQLIYEDLEKQERKKRQQESDHNYWQTQIEKQNELSRQRQRELQKSEQKRLQDYLLWEHYYRKQRRKNHFRRRKPLSVRQLLRLNFYNQKQ